MPFTKGHPSYLTTQSIRKIKKTLSGRKITWGNKISIAKSRKVLTNCKICSKKFLIQRKRISSAKYCSLICKYKAGHTKETKARISKVHLGLISGKNHYAWKGGITPINEKIRKSFKYRTWRTKVFKRDKYRCINCGTNGYLNADHIKPFSLFPKLRFRLSNGRTLCRSCHLKIGWKRSNKKL